MGIESINKDLYIIYSEKVTPIAMTLLGLISFFLCYPGVGPSDYESITVAVAGLYMAIESSDEFINELSEYKLMEKKGEYTVTSKILQTVSITFTLVVFIFFITILVSEGDDVTVKIEVIIMMIIGIFRICETAMEIYYMDEAGEYVKLMYEIQDGHLMSVIRDAYRLYLASNADDDLGGPSENDKKLALKTIQALQELPTVTLNNLQYAKRVNMITNILTNRIAGDDFNGTNASIWDEFNIQIKNENEINQNIPTALVNYLEEKCPFSDDDSLKVKQTHIWCFIPGTKSIDIDGGLTAAVLGDYCKNFIPGIGVIWRYPPFDEDIAGENGQDRWILMYKGRDGIVPETFDKTWDESINILKEYNQRLNDHDGRTGSGKDGDVEYDTMTLLEVIAATYTNFVQTGKKMYQEKFTRVKEQTNSEQYGIHHLFIGRFNMSGLNNDAYLDVGGNECRFHKRGLSVCKRFMV